MGVQGDLWWEFRPGEHVMTTDGYPGIVTAVTDLAAAGQSEYEVLLDADMGGGRYGPSQLRPMGGDTSISTESSAGSYVAQDHATSRAAYWYPEFGTLLDDKLPPTIEASVEDYLAGKVSSRLTAEALSLAEARVTEQQETLDMAKEGWSLYDKFVQKRPYDHDHLAPNVNWCRVRRLSTCFYPKELNKTATAQAGYDVWIPFERGPCTRYIAQQKQCPIAEPGPGQPGGYLDATVTWEQGGQHGGVPVPGWNDPNRTAATHSDSAEQDEHPAVHDDHPVLHILPTDAEKAAEILLDEIATRKEKSLGRTSPENTHEAADQGLIDAARGDGFTVRHHIADSPKTGFMGSYAGSEDVFPDTASNQEVGQHIDHFMAQHKSDIDSDPNNYFGAWHQDGKIYLDKSRNFTDEDKAVKFGYQNHQLALWHLDKGQEVKLFDSGHDGTDHPRAQQNVANGQYRVVDHPDGHRAVDPYGTTPMHQLAATAEDEAEERKLRAKYTGGVSFRDADTQSVITHLRSQQMDHEEFGDL